MGGGFGMASMKDELSRIAHLFLSSADSPAGKITVRALLTKHLPDPVNSSERIAAHFAKQLGSAALLLFDKGQARLRLFSTAPISPVRPSSPKRADQPDHLARAVADLHQRTSLLLLAVDSNGELLDQCPQISLVTCPKSKAVVDAYSQLKQLTTSSAQTLGLTMIDCQSVAQGQHLAQRLCQAAKEFLGLMLRLDAVVLRSSRLHQSTIARAASIGQSTLARSIGSLRSI